MLSIHTIGTGKGVRYWVKETFANGNGSRGWGSWKSEAEAQSKLETIQQTDR